MRSPTLLLAAPYNNSAFTTEHRFMSSGFSCSNRALMEADWPLRYRMQAFVSSR